MKLGQVCSTICHIARILKEESSETETDTFILLPSLFPTEENITYYSPLDVAINHITSQFQCSAVVSSLWHSPGRWAKFRQGLAFSSFSKFPKPWGRNSSVPTRGQKGGDEIDEIFAKNVYRQCSNFWMIFVHDFLFIMLVICKNLQDP